MFGAFVNSLYICTIKVKENFESTNVSCKTNKMITLDKIRVFVDAEKFQGNVRCSVRLSSKLSDVVYLHVEDSSLSFSFLYRLSIAVSSDFHIFPCFSGDSGKSFDIQFVLD